ncbi:MAG: hypothetical protein M1836_001190 [Candelina mexicana]|nr:MAG: hypothetical protein M1836_001190 [Candelina mexicana]
MLALRTALLAFFFTSLALAREFEIVYVSSLSSLSKAIAPRYPILPDISPHQVEVRQISGTPGADTANSSSAAVMSSGSSTISGSSSRSTSGSMASSAASSSGSGSAATVSAGGAGQGGAGNAAGGGAGAGAAGAVGVSTASKSAFAAPTGRPGGWAVAGAAVGVLGLVV